MLGYVLGLVLVAAPVRVGVVALGPDVAAAGELQAALERQLAGPEATIAPAAALAPILDPSTEPAKVVSPPEAEKLLKQAIDAYYEGSIPFALDRLSALAALLDRTTSVPASDRIRLHLWRTAVYWALKDETHAKDEALAALAIAPDLAVDLTDFPPTVAELVEQQRPRLALVKLTVTGLPAGGRLFVDDRPATSSVRVVAGRHRVVASAPGRRTLTTTVDAARDTTVAIPLPFDLADEHEKALASVVASGTIARENAEAIEQIADGLGVDALVLTSSDAGETKAVVVRLPKGPVSVLKPVRGPAGRVVAGWASGELAALSRPKRVSLPIALTSRGGLVFAQRTRTLDGGRALRTPFSGAGAFVGVEGRRGAFFADTDVEWTRWSFSEVEVALPDDTRRRVTGGSTIAADLSGGMRHSFGETIAHAKLGATHERLSAEPVRDATGDDAGLLPSYTRTALVARAGATYPVARGGGVLGELSISPVSSWTESPSGSSGSSPRGGVSVGWRLRGSWERGALVSSLEYAGEQRSVAFSGAANTPEPQSDATVTEIVHRVRLVATWRF